MHFIQIIKKALISILIFTPLLVFTGISYYQMVNDPPDKPGFVSWFDDPSHKVYIGWETATESNGTVYYGTSSQDLQSKMESPILKTIHHVNLTGLVPDTLYFYEIRLDPDNILHGQGQFRTAPLNQQTSFKWAISGDTQQPIAGEGHFSKVVKAVKDANYSFFSLVGDLVYDGSVKKAYNDFFNRSGPLFKTTPFIPVLGNHDNYEYPNTWFYKYFINNQSTGTPRFFYSFNYSMVHFTIVHYTYGNPSDFTQAQLDWFKQDLQNAQDKPFRVVLWHCPIRGGSFFGPNTFLIEEILPLLEQYHVQLIIHGHEHSYQRWQLGNLTQIVVGVGGSAFDVGLRAQPGFQCGAASPGYLSVESSSSKLDLTALSPEGTILDHYIINATI